MNTQPEVFVKMVLDAWHAQLKRTDDLFNSLSDEDLMNEASPGRNRGIYLLGHLAAVHDRMLPLLGLGEPANPAMFNLFVEKPDRAEANLPSATDLRQYWKDVNANLENHFSTQSTEDWFQRHTSVSEEDFAKEPHRNKLNIIITRTNHLAGHYGQLLYLQKKKS